MQAFYVTNTLVVPSACMIYGARSIKLKYGFNRFFRVELPPAFVKRHPHGYTGAVIKLYYHLTKLVVVLYPSFFVVSSEAGVVVLRVARFAYAQKRQRDRCALI